MITKEQQKHRSKELKECQQRNLIYVKDLRKRPTKSEKMVQKWFNENKIYHIFQKGFITPFHRIADFYIPGKKIIIEIDGPIHQKLLLKDFRKDEVFLRMRGMDTIRIKNESVYDGTFKEVLEFLKN